MDSHYRIKNWERFQHYNKPRPAWIKLHRTLLDDHEFQSLSTRSRALLVMLWLIAAESADGTIPAPEAIAWRLRLPVREITSDIQLLKHYLEPLYTESRAVLASDRDREETEKETEGERAREKARFLRFVFLTNEEEAKLRSRLNGQFQVMLERLDGYIGQIGEKKAKTKYKSHYDVILNWWRKDNPDQEQEQVIAPKRAQLSKDEYDALRKIV